uniref:Uncharacterized protein n=1 Tax=Romanomermis culicivorax TaxID=13658 RepID=A0A915JE77_ROMCU
PVFTRLPASSYYNLHIVPAFAACSINLHIRLQSPLGCQLPGITASICKAQLTRYTSEVRPVEERQKPIKVSNFGFVSPKTKLLDYGQVPPLCSLNMKAMIGMLLVCTYPGGTGDMCRLKKFNFLDLDAGSANIVNGKVKNFNQSLKFLGEKLAASNTLFSVGITGLSAGHYLNQ